MQAADIQSFRDSLEGMGREALILAAVEQYTLYQEASARLKEHEQADHEFFLQFQEMKNRLAGAERDLETLREQNRHLAGVRAVQAQEMYGRSSEKMDGVLGSQPDGDDYTDPLDEDAPEPPSDTVDDGDRGNIIRFPSKGGKKGGKASGKRERDLSGLPECIVYEYDIDELNRTYGEGNWRFAFWEEHVFVEVQKQCTYKKIVYTPKVSVGLEHAMVSVPYEGRIIPKSIVSSSLLAMILTDLGALHLPLYRQEHDPDRFGFPLSRQTMSGWVLYAALNYLSMVYDYLCKLLKPCPYQQCDETHYRVISENTHEKNYVWVHRTSEMMDIDPIIIYCFEPSRSADHLYRFYDGLDSHVFLTSDAYSAYHSLELAFPELVTECGCMMHLRRRLVVAIQVADKGLSREQQESLPATRIVRMIAEMYVIENGLADMSADERLERRKNEIVPIMDRMYDFINGLDVTDPNHDEKLLDALQYAKNNERQLRMFLTDGNIPIDNGATERDVKDVSLHRKNSLFSYSVDGARAVTITMSLIETAKANNAIPFYYLKYLLEELARGITYCHPYSIEDMMPWSATYRSYEQEQRRQVAERGAPPGNEKPRTPQKKPVKVA